jgi:serine/threonine-protein kinase HipA
VTAVWLYGTELGQLTRPRSGRLRFDFSSAAIDRWGTASTMLSTSMPMNVDVRPTGDVVAAFFANVLPEGDALTTMRTMYRAVDDFALLVAIGRDSAGALIIADDPSVTDESPRWVTDDDVAELIFQLPQRPLGASLTVRHSLAGAQRKLLIGRNADDRWFEASAAHPSTHILKPAPFDHHEVADNEAFCMAVARAAGLPTCATETMQIGSARVLIAERYDRAGGERIHQEDGCQMLAVPPERKYEERRSGAKRLGPSLAAVASWLPDEERVRLLEAQVLTVLVGNADGHGKNTSILHLPDGRIRLAPLYDVMSTTAHHPIPTATGPKPLSRDLGLLIGNARTLDDVTMNEFAREAMKWPIARDRAVAIVTDVVQRVVAAADARATDYPEIAAHIQTTAERICP